MLRAILSAGIPLFLLWIPPGLAQGTQTGMPYDGVEFSPIITDASDHPIGFLDIREVAIGEPGNETFVVRFTVENVRRPNRPSDTVALWYRVGEEISRRSGTDSTGRPIGDVLFDSCLIYENSIYCVMPYAALKARAGDKMRETYAVSYASVEVITIGQDWAPGGLFYGETQSRPKGKDYELQGSTRRPSDANATGPTLVGSGPQFAGPEGREGGLDQETGGTASGSGPLAVIATVFLSSLLCLAFGPGRRRPSR